MNLILILANSSILDASKQATIGQFIQALLSTVCLMIDSMVYYIVSIAFKLFLAISQFEIFSDAAFNDLINRTYVVIGVISLFLVAYALLNAIINPDNFSKGDKSVSKIVKNIVIAIIGIAVVPTVFNWFYEFQSAVLCNNTIPKLLLDRVDDDGNTVENTATEFSALLFESFFYPNSIASVDGEVTALPQALEEIKLKSSDPFTGTENYTLAMAYEHAEEGKMFLTTFWPFIMGDWFENSIANNSVQYLIILSTIAGGFCAYVLISMCIDMGIRAIKLGYLELIAPLAIMTKVVPGKDSVFKNWSKKTVSCALEAFVRLFIVVFAIYLVRTIKDIQLEAFGSYICGLKLGFVLVVLLRALIYCSIFAFIKQAPKFFSEATGIKSDGFKIGLMDKMKENGMIQGLGAIGGGVTAGIRNMAPSVVNGWKNNTGIGKKIGGAWQGAKQSLPSGVAGLASGMRRGWSNTKDVKKWSDVKDGAGKAADEAMEAKFKRKDYKDSHGGTFWGAVNGHKDDFIDKIKDYPNSHRANYEYENKKHQSIDNITKVDTAINDKAKALRDKYSNLVVYDGESLDVIRKNEESINSTLDGLNKDRARIIAVGGNTDSIDSKIKDYEKKSIDAKKRVLAAEKSINTDIRSGKYDSKFSVEEQKSLNNLFIQYRTALDDNISALSGNTALYNHASKVLEQTKNPEDFRSVISAEYNDKNISKLIDEIKIEDAEVVKRINQESNAVKKQSEKK